ncbi:MAG: pentapeptide repeat-containing protein [Pseudomonadota bacterium]
MTSQVLLSKEAVHSTLEPHLESLGRADRERVKSLLGLIRPDGRMLLSDVLGVLYPNVSADNYEPALSAFRQFRLRLKTFTEQVVNIHFVLKSDTQTRTRPDQRWCWFEGDDQSVESMATFSDTSTESVNRISYLIEQTALEMSFDNHLLSLATHNPYLPDKKKFSPKEKPSNVMDLLSDWIENKSQPYCALLGEFGMGKTVTSMRFTQYLLEKRKEDPSLPLPIFLDLRNLYGRERFEAMSLSEMLDRLVNNGVYGGAHLDNVMTAKDIMRLVQDEGALVIFDGLDEVLVHLSVAESQRFTHKLLSILQPGSRSASSKPKGRLLISCRTHYFRTIREQSTLFIEKSAGISANDYCVLAMLPLTNDQIRTYLLNSLPHIDINTIFKLIESVHNLLELAERPYTLNLIPSLVPQIEEWQNQGYRITGATIYRHMVLSWLERDSGKHKLTVEHKQKIMEYLAAELWRSGKYSWSISDLEQWFVDFLREHPEIDIHYTLGRDENRLYRVIEMLKEDLRTATFLVPVGAANFRFAHTSLQEFFLATYLYRALDTGKIQDWDMPVVNKETLDFLGQILSEGNSSTAITSLEKIRDEYRPKASELAFAYMLLANNNGYPTPSLSGFQLNGADLEELTIFGRVVCTDTTQLLLDLRHSSFRGANLNRANLIYLDLEGADFTGAHLNSTEFMFDHIGNATFTKADLKESFLRETDCTQADFSEACLDNTIWKNCNLEGAKGLVLDNPTIIYSLCEPANVFNHSVPESSTSYSHLINNCIIFYPDGKFLVSAMWDNTLKVWDTDSGECIKVLKGHTQWIRGCAVSSDGKLIASASEDHTLRLWDTNTGECIRILEGHTMMVRSCSFSPDGRLLVSASWDQTLRLWNVETGECLRVMSRHKRGINSCAYSPTGQNIASAENDDVIAIWEASTGVHLYSLMGHTSMVRTCAYSPDGQYLVSGSVDKTLRIWSALTGECLHILEGHTSRVNECGFSHDGKRVVSSSEDKTVRIWDVQTGKTLFVIDGHHQNVRTCVYSPDGSKLASGGYEQGIRLWDAQTAKLIKILT